ncbi:hypothetical protein [Sphingobacterium hotanense]|uniref:Uncharacterized protein n=1 Tax=Sphingobacterium hotanense TaxID=649196 RepID=A0ABT7NKP0_9SPHI|nr:hypothetical protein [Sphingobacterium hotanense]MDM1047736.1 hypothetical protein [Sphingobacterium hotanense]
MLGFGFPFIVRYELTQFIADDIVHVPEILDFGRFFVLFQKELQVMLIVCAKFVLCPLVEPF